MTLLTVGEILREERKKHKITFKKASQDLRVHEKYLRAIEKNDWSIFSSKTYISGIIRSYASYVHVDPEKALAFFRREYETREEQNHLKKRTPLDVQPEPKKFITLAIIIGVLIFSSYFGYQLYLFLTPPEVEIVAPESEILRGREFVTIVGKTEENASVKVFDNDVVPDPEGTFTFDLPLKKGKNPVVIEVTGANGKKTVIEKEYFLE